MDQVGKYTNWEGRRTFKEEREMVRRAIENDDDRVIREYLKPLVLLLAKNFKKNQLGIKLTNEEYLEAGFMHLDLGLKKYHERLETERIGFKFSSYFEWFIRQGIIEYLNSKG